MPETRKLNVFLSYASQDETKVRELYCCLNAEAWISTWFDKEMLLPGMDWDLEIYKGLRTADLILIFLSKESVAKEGYVQKEFKRALSYAEEKPEGTIFVIPVRLDDCQLPIKFQQWQWLNLFEPNAPEKLLKSLKLRADGLKIPVSESVSKSVLSVSSVVDSASSISDLHTFIKINVLGQKPFWIGKYPVTNAQYARFLQADDYANPQFWLGFPKFDENCVQIGNWGEEGLNWLREKLKDYQYFPPEMWRVEPEFWQDERVGISQPNNPVIYVNFYEANAYCLWLAAHWRELPESTSLSSFILPNSSFVFRLPLETEWVAAAGGDHPAERYPWDLPGKATTNVNEIVKRANVEESRIGKTTPVNQYPAGKSPHGVMDMAGNVWEWQANFYDKGGFPAIHGGSWNLNLGRARVSFRNLHRPELRYYRYDHFGFRLLVSPI